MIEPQRNFVYVLHWGDLTSTVRMLATAKSIRTIHKRDRIVLLTTPEFEAFLKHCPFFNAVEIDAIPDSRPLQGLRDKRVKLNKPVRIYDLVGDGHSRKIKNLFRFSKCEWLEVVADRNLAAHPVDAAAGKMGELTGYGETFYPLGAAPAPDATWVDFLVKKSRMLDPEYFGLNGPFALLAPAGEDVKPVLRWPKERWASLAHQLLEMGITPAIVGGPDARDVGKYVAHVCPSARDITGKAKLTQLAGLARRTRFVFGEDTPLLHLLVASGSPALALYPGPDNPDLISPRGDVPVILMRAPTLAQVHPDEAMQAMRFAGGFDQRVEPA